MGKINWPRVILGGAVAGLIINLFEFILNGVILAEDMNAAISALGRHLGGPELLMFNTWAFLVGIFMVWLYAAIRPRYGAGPKTALAAAGFGFSGISWPTSHRLRSSSSRRVSWSLASRWDSWKSSWERWSEHGCIERQPPDVRNHRELNLK
jgi:hypothetical protein